MVEKQGKVIVCNILIILTAIAAIITLAIGSFWKVTVELTVNNDTAKKLAGKEKEEDIDKLGQFEFKIPIELEINGKALLTSVGGDASKVATDVVANTITDLLDNVMKNLSGVLKTVMKASVNMVVEQAKEEVKKQIGENATDAEVSAKLQSEYGVSEEQINATLNEVSNAAGAILDGDTDTLRDILTDSEVVNSLFKAYAEKELEAGASEEAVAAKQAELKEKLVKEYDEKVEEFRDDTTGEISGTSVMIGVLGMVGVKQDGEEGEEKPIETEEDLKEFLSEKINTTLGDNAQYIGWGIKGMGIFLIVVMASWAYIIIKCVVKMFMKNKTVGMFFPRFFGWMPHVFFVGIPMLFLKYGPKILEKIGSSTEQIKETTDTMQEMVSLNIGSLTWVSALCTVILFAIWIPYYGWRRKIKRELKNK